MAEKMTPEECEALCQDVRRRLDSRATEESFLMAVWLRLRERFQIKTDDAIQPQGMGMPATKAQEAYHEIFKLLEARNLPVQDCRDIIKRHWSEIEKP